MIDSRNLTQLDFFNFLTVNHQILLNKLEYAFGLVSTVLILLKSFLFNRFQDIRHGKLNQSVHWVSSPAVYCKVQSVFYSFYTLQSFIANSQLHGMRPNLFAQNTQIDGSCTPANISSLQSRFSSCLAHVADLIQCNRLQMNNSKIEAIWSKCICQQHQSPSDPLFVGNDLVAPSSLAHNL